MSSLNSLDHQKICQTCGCWWWSLMVLDVEDLICQRCLMTPTPPPPPSHLKHVDLPPPHEGPTYTDYEPTDD